MKNKHIVFVIVLIVSLVFNGECIAQTVHRERTFTASGLYGFMNGGTDLFLEYDVRKLTVRELTYEGEEYSVEIYEMPTPEDAFGIYSLHTFKCLRADTLGCIDCLSPYQLQTVSGNLYVSVVFPSGSQKAKEGADELLRKYVSIDEAGKPDIPALLEIQPPYSGNLKYIRGPISASNVSFSLAKKIENMNYKGVWFVSEKPSKNYRAWVYLQDSEEDEYLYISGSEEEPEEDHGIFGF